MKYCMSFLCCSLIFQCLIAQNCLIKNVTVIDTRNGKAIARQDVLIENGQIKSIYTFNKTATAAHGKLIDGTGKFLMPGMADAHIHFFQTGGIYTRPDVVDLRNQMPYRKEEEFAFNNAADFMQRYLRLGITSLVDAGGPFANFTIRDSISKTIIAPNVLVTGPLFSMVEDDFFGKDKPIEKIASDKEADILFEKMMARKPDFIKIWYIANADIPAEKNYSLVKYIAGKTHAQGLKLAVHATELKTAQLAVEAGADILVHSIDDALIPDDFIKKLKEKKVTYIPTLIVGINYYKSLSGKLPHHTQDLAWANAFSYGSLTDPEGMESASLPPVLKMLRKAGIPESEQKTITTMHSNLRKLFSAGVNIATGTDAGNIGTMHASSYLQELEAMEQAGLTNAEILKASTINVATGFGKEKIWGSIEKGKMADLVLLTKNPLQDLQNLNSVEIVFKEGKLLMADSILHENPEAIVQRQLNGYNARNIDAFMNTYADDVELYNFPSVLIVKGKEAMKKDFESMFKKVNNLYCKIEKRIVLGNKIIDHEKVRMGINTIHAVAVYEVEKGKIKKVTFIR